MGFFGNLIKYFNDGGPVMWPLLLASVAAFAFMMERILMMILVKRKASPADFMNKMDEILDREKDSDKVAEQLVAYCKERGGTISEVMLAGLTKFQQARKNKMGLKDAKDWINTAIAEKGTVEIPTLEKNLAVLATVAMVAPLMGLLGTVTGMIVAFNTMAESAGAAKPDELAGGISQALITTATGLIIAIPTLLVYNWLRSMVDNMVLEMEEVAMIMTDKLIEEA